MKTIAKIILSLILVVVIGGTLYLGYLGFIPGVSSIFGSNKPRDLGVKFTQEDYQKADSKADVEVVALSTAAPSEELSMVCEGQKEVFDSFSSQELTAVINTHAPNWKYYPVSDAQLKINEDGSAVFSGLLHADRLAGYAAATGANYAGIQKVLSAFKLLPDAMPIYLAAKATVVDGQVSLNVSRAEIGRAAIPNDMISKNQGAVNGFFTQQVNAFPGLNIKKLDFNKGQMNFDGTMPEKISTYLD